MGTIPEIKINFKSRIKFNSVKFSNKIDFFNQILYTLNRNKLLKVKLITQFLRINNKKEGLMCLDWDPQN